MSVAIAAGLVLVASACMHEVAPLGPLVAQADGQKTVINDAGVLAGVTVDATSGMPHAFVKVNDEPIRMIDGGAPLSGVAAINEDGVVVGTIGATDPGETPSSGHPFIWSPKSGLTELPLPDGMFGAAAVDINAGGTVLVNGFPDMWAEQSRPFLWNRDTGYTPIPTRDLYGDKPLAISDDGVLVGQAVFRSGEGQQAAWWDAATHTVHELDDGGAQFSWATDISPSGKVSGTTTPSSGGQRVAYWPNVTAKPTLLEGDEATSINDQGLMAGYVRLPAENYRLTAVLWDTAKGSTVRLGDYSRGGSRAEDVNGNGVAVGTAGEGIGGKANVVRWDAYKPAA